MPKKPPHDVTAKDLFEIAAKLSKYGVALESYAQTMKDVGIEKFEATNGGQRDTAVKNLEIYVDVIHKRLAELTNPTKS